MTPKQRREAAMFKQQAIVNAAKSDGNRALTAEEQAQFNDLQREIDEAQAEIDSQERGLAGDPEREFDKAGHMEGNPRLEVTDFQAVPGNGLYGQLGGDKLTGGNLAYIKRSASVSAKIEEKAAELAGEGKTPLFFGRNGRFIGMIAVADVIKEDSPKAVKELQNMGIQVVMLTGDNDRQAGRSR